MKRLWLVLLCLLTFVAFPGTASADVPDQVTVEALEESFNELGPRYRTPDISPDGGDGEVNILDFSLLVSRWGQEDGFVDLNDDGVIGAADFLILSYWYWHDDPDINGDGWVDWRDIDALRGPSGGANYFVVRSSYAGIYFAWRCDGQFFCSGEIAPTTDGKAPFGAAIPYWSYCSVGVVDTFRVEKDGFWENWLYAGTTRVSGEWPAFEAVRAEVYSNCFQ